MRYGITDLAPKFFAPATGPDIALSGINVGWNPGPAAFFAGTIAAAVEAAEMGYAAIAFSGRTGEKTAWNKGPNDYEDIYSELAIIIVNTLTDNGKAPKPYLPPKTWLNVNFSKVSDRCAAAKDFAFVLSRIFRAVPFLSDDDVETCNGGDRLPHEIDVMNEHGDCYVAISLGLTRTKTDASKEQQAVVLEKLSPILTCFDD